MRFSPPPSRAFARLASSCWMMSCMVVLSRFIGGSSAILVDRASARRRSAASSAARRDRHRQPRRQSTAASVVVERAAHRGVRRETLAQAGVDALPQPRARLAAAPLVQRAARCPAPPGTPATVSQNRRDLRRQRARSSPSPAAASARVVAAVRPNRCSADSIWPTARAAAAASRSALLTTTRSASSITPFLIACRSSPALGSCRSRNMSVMPATAASLWPTPTVSTMTTS